MTPSLVQTLWVLVPTLTRGLSLALAVLMLGGLWRWRRIWARRDQQPLFCVAMLILAGIWVQFCCDRLICPRYALPIVLMGSPFAALGLLGLTAWLTRWAARVRFSTRWQAAAVFAPTALVCVLGVGDAMTCNRNYFALRQHAMLLGRWLRDHPADSASVRRRRRARFAADSGRARRDYGDCGLLCRRGGLPHVPPGP